MRAVTYPSQHKVPVPGRGVLKPCVLGPGRAWANLRGSRIGPASPLGRWCETRCVSAAEPWGHHSVVRTGLGGPVPSRSGPGWAEPYGAFPLCGRAWAGLGRARPGRAGPGRMVM